MTAGEVMICACPQCGTRFRVTAAMLAVADGQVRCGACLTVFRGRDHRQDADSPPPRQDALAADAAVGPAAPRRSTARARSRRTPLRRKATALTACTVLALVLVANTLGLMFDSWSQTPAMRSVYAAVCGIAGCELAPLVSLPDIDVLVAARSRLGPTQPWTLNIELLNRAPFRQPAPTLAVAFRATDGAVLEERRIPPGEYLSAGQPRHLMPNQPTNVALRLDDPGTAAAAYTVALL